MGYQAGVPCRMHPYQTHTSDLIILAADIGPLAIKRRIPCGNGLRDYLQKTSQGKKSDIEILDFDFRPIEETRPFLHDGLDDAVQEEGHEGNDDENKHQKRNDKFPTHLSLLSHDAPVGLVVFIKTTHLDRLDDSPLLKFGRQIGSVPLNAVFR